ncbi:MAG: hypothetical protein WC548_04205 [Candidatus Pacearchaeota archaeon]
MVKSRENLFGAYAFLVGVVIAVILGLLGTFSESLGQESVFFYLTLVIIGLIVGYMNVSDKNSSTFLMASLALVIVGALGNEPLKYIQISNIVATALRNILGSLLIMFVPATIIVSLKTVFAMAKL